LVAGELEALGIQARVDEGGVGFTGATDAVARANLWLRTATRVIVRVGTFRAQAFHELERLARAIPWERFIAAGVPVRIRVTSRKSRLYHTGAIQQRFHEALQYRLGRASLLAGAPSDDEKEGEDAQLFVIRVVRDVFTISADSSGALLHQRGYRQAVAKAPVRETLAAAMLLAGGWDGRTPLVDPMCGSGTIPIEGALIARRIAPGLHRSFAFVRWPEVDSELWARTREDAESLAMPNAPALIRGSDRDAGAITAANSNADRAGVLQDIDFVARSLSGMDCTAGNAGTVATNPPYGVRVGAASELRDLYARLGQVLRSRCSGWQFVLLSANPRLEAQLKLPLQELLRTRNGGIPVRILRVLLRG
jgi:putative N6-adenine-specific DNA methylase